MRPEVSMVSFRIFVFALAGALVCGAAGSPRKHPQVSRQLGVSVPGVVSRSQNLGHANPAKLLHVSISIPFANAQAMEDYVDEISDPQSPNYGRYLTPEQVGERFGVTDAELASVERYLRTHGFSIRLVAKNRLSILADCTVAEAEAAFGTRINEYQANSRSEPGNGRFYSLAKPLALPVEVAANVLDVAGLESFTRPVPRILTPSQTRVLYNSAPIYNAAYQGQGRSVAISNWDGFRLSNVPLYYAQYGLPTPIGGVGSNVHVVTVSGGAGAGTPQGEGDLDIQMVLGMAPLCDLTIYDGGSNDLIGVLTREVNDNTADIISESWGWGLPASMATAAHNLHLSMSAQGITYMGASGDTGTTIEPYSYPNYEPEVLMVGGTVPNANVNGNRTSEVGWSGSGGGWSNNTATFNTLPSWQVGQGVPTNVNHRLFPDVALGATGNFGAYPFFLNGAQTSGYAGTSFACPVFAGCLAIAEQKLIALGGLAPNGAGKRRFGRIQNLIYSQAGRSDVWYDITSGNNGNLPNGSPSSCTTKWDMVTGWGAINFDAFVASVAPSAVPATPTGLNAVGGNTQVSLTWNASSGASSYNVKRATVPGGPYSTVGTAASNAYLNTSLSNGTTYYFVVSAVNGSGESADSNEASATPSLTIPATPTGVTAIAGNAQVSLNWTASAGSTSYSVKRAAVTGGPYSVVASPVTNSYVDSAVTNGTTYYYVLSASNGAGESANSGQVSATPSAVNQLLLNPGFESGNVSWIASANVISSSGQAPNTGSWKAWLCGYGTTHTDTMYQQVSIPSNITSATLTFYLHIDTAETSPFSSYDKLQVQIRSATNGVLKTLATYSNQHKNVGFVQKSFNVTAYKGKTVRVYLVGTENSTRQTSFVVDDFSLVAQ